MKKIFKYLITAAVVLVAALILLLTRGTFSQTDTQKVFLDLCDAFFVPGAVLTGFGLLVFASNGGTFDMLAYGMRRFFGIFQKDVTKVKYRTFYDYRQAKKEKKRDFSYLIFVGLGAVAISSIFLWLYHSAG